MRVFNAGVLTISDKGHRGERVDESGPVVKEIISSIPVDVIKFEIIPDEETIIADKLREWVDRENLDLIITSGGTGVTPRDVTPEATRAVIEKEIPGIAEVMRSASMSKTHNAMLSRAVAGCRGKCLIINVPGSPKGVRDYLESVLDVIPHCLDMLAGNTEHNH
jgi:molybdenum cofactor synthesis domain-containing protein